jgi:hypothetical protein
MTQHDRVVAHIESRSWFTYDGISAGVLSFSTREHGNVGDEEPGEEDIRKAHQVAGEIRERFPVRNIEISSVDEWTYIQFEMI